MQGCIFSGFVLTVKTVARTTMTVVVVGEVMLWKASQDKIPLDF